MSRLKYTVLFTLHRRNADDRDAYLICRVKWSGSRSIVSLNLGFVVDSEKWEPKTQMCALRSSHGPMRIPAQTINAEIRAYREAIDDVMGKYDGVPTVGQVRSDLRVRLGIDAPSELTTDQAWSRFFAEESVRCSWALGTVKKLRAARLHMLAFSPFLLPSGFGEKNLAAFVTFLREHEGLNDVTIHRQLGYLRWFLKWCYDRRIVRDDAFMRFRPKFRQPARPVIFLTWEELMRVWEYRAPADHPYLDDVRDVFLFSCFTSLRYSDTQNLKWSDVQGGSIHIPATVKTAEELTIELNRWSSEIIDRHIDRDHGDDHVLPQIPNQVMNRYLKGIMKDCGIDEPVRLVEFRGSERTDSVRPKHELIGTHAGRRTFICNALMMGISPTVVMQWTGHSDYRAMKPYIAISDQARADAMKAFDAKTLTPDGDPC